MKTCNQRNEFLSRPVDYTIQYIIKLRMKKV